MNRPVTPETPALVHEVIEHVLHAALDLKTMNEIAQKWREQKRESETLDMHHRIRAKDAARERLDPLSDTCEGIEKVLGVMTVQRFILSEVLNDQNHPAREIVNREISAQEITQETTEALVIAELKKHPGAALAKLMTWARVKVEESEDKSDEEAQKARDESESLNPDILVEAIIDEMDTQYSIRSRLQDAMLRKQPEKE